MNVLNVIIAGLCGICARYAVLRWFVATAFPLATLVVNVTGCFIAGMVIGGVSSGYITPQTRNWLIVGFCGAYTTMSAFALETVALWQTERYGAAAGNILANVALCLLAVFVGKYLASCL